MNKLSKQMVSFLLAAVTAASIFVPSANAYVIELSEGLLGDVNRDNVISLKDASLVQRASLSLDELTADQLYLADVDGNNGITLKDAYLIQRYSIGIKADYPKNTDGSSIGEEVCLVNQYDDTESDTEETDSVISESDTEETDSIISESDTEETDSVISASDTEDTDSGEPVVELPLEQINEELNGGFENGDELPDGWQKIWDYMNASSAKSDGVNGSTAIKISHGTQDRTSFVVHRAKGLKPGADYKVRVKVRGDSIEKGERENGLTVDIGSCLNCAYQVGKTDEGKLEPGRGYKMHSAENWFDGTFDWKEITIYFVADYKGMADIVCYLNGTGTAWFDDMVIETADFDSEVTDVVRYVGKHTGIIIYKDDVPGQDKDILKYWTDDLDFAYEQMADLMGAEPYGGDICYFLSTEEATIETAVGCVNPIRWKRQGMSLACHKACVDRCGVGYAYHEMGHNFDMMYPWSYQVENSADFKMAYVFMQKSEDERFYVNYLDFDTMNKSEYENYILKEAGFSYENTFAQRRKYKQINYFESMVYVFFRTCNAVGWDTVKATFRQFNEYYDTSYDKAYSKYLYWLMNLQNMYNKNHPEATGFEIIDSFPEGEYDYLKYILNGCEDKYEESQNIHCVQFFDPDGNRLWFEFVPHGKAASQKDIPDHEKYGAFTGWDCDLSCVMSDMTVTANYENFQAAGTITYSSEDSNVYQGEFVEFAATASGNGNYTYNFMVSKDGEKVFESGSSSSNTAKIFFQTSGKYLVSAQLKDSEGNETSTSRLVVNVKRAATIYYSGFNNPNIHYKSDTGSWTKAPGKPMISNSDVLGYSYKYIIPINSEGGKAEMCFNDGTNWDNNSEKNYFAGEGAYGIKNGTVTQITG